MKRTNTDGRLRRMEMLAVQLKEDGHCTVKDLAARHGVSMRTIARDLQLMRDRGMQIDADRGRGGGVRLDRNWGVGRLNLAYPEAIDLLISIAVAEQMKSPLFLANLGSVRRQLVASFTPEKRTKVDRLKSRILIGSTSSVPVQAGFASVSERVVQSLHQAFLDQEMLEIVYQREDTLQTKRNIEPHYLLLKYPVWYVVAFDHLRNGPRTFRCDRILSAIRTGTYFRLLSKQAFTECLTDDDLAVIS